MKFVLTIILVVLISGCAKEPYRDPYIAAVNDYITGLNSTDYTADDELKPPPQPSYLYCPTQPEPFPELGQGPYGVLNERQSLSPRKLSAHSTAQCEQINSQRKQAYEAALEKYRRVAADADK